MPFTRGAVAQMEEYKQGYFFSPEFIGDNSWNGYERNVLFECREAPGQFVEAGRALGCDGVEDGRGVAVADLNADGLLDIVVSNNNGPPSLFINRLENAGNWLQIRLIGGDRCNRDAIGARVEVVINSAGNARRMARWIEAGSGYASQSEGRLHFGLGQATQMESLLITWPDGEQQKLDLDHVPNLINATVVIPQGAEPLFQRASSDLGDAG